jgi:hypothetical protein
LLADALPRGAANFAEAHNINEELKTLLQALLEAVNEINKKVPQDEKQKAEEMLREAESLLKEADPSRPQKWYQVRLNGLTQAAKGLGDMAVPILTIVEKLSRLFP